MISLLRKILIGILIAAALLLTIPIAMRISVQRYIYTSVEAVPKAEAALVLGASVVRGQPSPILGARADAAIALYKAGTVSKILVTGDNGELSHDEVTPVKNYLLEHGVAAGDIFLDHAGFDTYSSMYRARDVFDAHSIVIVTQDFHLPRSVFIARQLGLDARGLVAEGGETSLYEYLREVPAAIKALLNIAEHRTPKYLGDQIPLTGDGSTTWY
ncbi:MAG TPA: ElyC/SanA/YdcF family protein [Candidatus Paceibacterota bacterium]|nr:ElyC/SanA/YdcF family protein [Candidatus Paceibacterota bacterium]